MFSSYRMGILAQNVSVTRRPWSRWMSMIPVLILTLCFVIFFFYINHLNSRPGSTWRTEGYLNGPFHKFSEKPLKLSKTPWSEWFSGIHFVRYIIRRQCVFVNFPPPRKPLMKKEKKISLMNRIRGCSIKLRSPDIFSEKKIYLSADLLHWPESREIFRYSSFLSQLFHSLWSNPLQKPLGL